MPGQAKTDLYRLNDESYGTHAMWVAAVIRSLSRVAAQGASDELLLRTLHAHIAAGPFEVLG